MVKFIKPTRKVAIGTIIVAVLLLGLIGFLIWNGVAAHSDRKTGDLTAVAPPFQAVLPANVAIEDLGGWQKLTPPSGDAYFVFTDEINSVRIQVSQQPMPSSFKANPTEKIAEMARAYNATETFDVHGTKVYLGNSVKGPQSVIFTRKNVLVLINSDKKIEDAAWVNYIKSLT